LRQHLNDIKRIPLEIKSCVALKNRLLASGSDNHAISIWNYTTGELVMELTGHTDGVTVLFLLNSDLASVSLDGTMRVWYFSNDYNDFSGKINKFSRKSKNRLLLIVNF
jgi:WD40 repeat protein